MFNRNNPVYAPILFYLILMNLAWAGFFSVYWLKDNSWSLDPEEMNVVWVSDEDYRAMQVATAPEFKMANGSTLVLPTDPTDRKASLAGYQLATPDGKWHGRASTKLGASACGPG